MRRGSRQLGLEVLRRLSASAFASFQRLAPAAVAASVQSAARTPATLFAAIEAPVPGPAADHRLLGARPSATSRAAASLAQAQSSRSSASSAPWTIGSCPRSQRLDHGFGDPGELVGCDGDPLPVFLQIRPAVRRLSRHSRSRRPRGPSRTAAGGLLEPGGVVAEDVGEPLAQGGGSSGLAPSPASGSCTTRSTTHRSRSGRRSKLRSSARSPGRRTARSIRRKPPELLPPPVSHSRSNSGR